MNANIFYSYLFHWKSISSHLWVHTVNTVSLSNIHNFQYGTVIFLSLEFSGSFLYFAEVHYSLGWLELWDKQRLFTKVFKCFCLTWQHLIREPVSCLESLFSHSEFLPWLVWLLILTDPWRVLFVKFSDINRSLSCQHEHVHLNFFFYSNAYHKRWFENSLLSVI